MCACEHTCVCCAHVYVCVKVHMHAEAVKIMCLPQLVSNVFWGHALSLNQGLPISLSRMDREPQASCYHHFPITQITGTHPHFSHGFWGLELRLSGLYNNNFTHWAVSSALFAVMILFPKVKNHISTTWTISRRWIKPYNVIPLPHVGELENRKGIAFAQGHATSGIKTFFVP